MTKEKFQQKLRFWKEVLGLNKVITWRVIPQEEKTGFDEATVAHSVFNPNPVIMLSRQDNDVTLELSLIKVLLRIKLAPYEQTIANAFNFLLSLEDGDLVVEALSYSFFDVNEKILDELTNAFYLAYEGGKQK